MSGEKNLQARTIFCIYPRSGFSSTGRFHQETSVLRLPTLHGGFFTPGWRNHSALYAL